MHRTPNLRRCSFAYPHLIEMLGNHKIVSGRSRFVRLRLLWCEFRILSLRRALALAASRTFLLRRVFAVLRASYRCSYCFGFRIPFPQACATFGKPIPIFSFLFLLTKTDCLALGLVCDFPVRFPTIPFLA